MNEEGRYRIYRLRGDALYLLGTAEAQAVGLAIITMAEEGEFEGSSLGILDSKDRTWLINPWSRGAP